MPAARWRYGCGARHRRIICPRSKGWRAHCPGASFICPMRYFLAKSTDGPVLIVADRIDDTAAELVPRQGMGAQSVPLELHANGSGSSCHDTASHRMPRIRNSVYRAFFRSAKTRHRSLRISMFLIGRYYIDVVLQPSCVAGSLHNAPCGSDRRDVLRRNRQRRRFALPQQAVVE